MLVNFQLFKQSYVGKEFFSRGLLWTVAHTIENLKHKQPKFVCKAKSEDGEKFATFSLMSINRRMI